MGADVNRERLRAILSDQAAEKRFRDFKEHLDVYGDIPAHNYFLSHSVSHAASALTKAEERVLLAHVRRQELETQIAAKQLERHQLRKQLVDEQRGLDHAAAVEEALTWQHSQHKKREQQVEMQLAFVKQQA